jgi:D-sedoheptulose 7-phosphate isomerase
MDAFLLKAAAMAPLQRPRVPEVEPAIFDSYLRSYFAELSASLEELDPAVVTTALQVIERARLENRQIFIIGNGGSAATASHMACDLGKGTVDYRNPGFRRYRAISLTDNTALITALGNDIGFEDVFAEQLAALMNDGDVVVFISASGNSPNLVRAAHYARSRGGELIGLLGFGGGVLGTLVDHALVVSSRNYGLSEDSHLIIQHVLTQYLRRLLAGPARPVAFLDRDGVINERPEPHQYVTSWEQFRWVDGILPLLRGLSDLGFALIVVTNQQGIGKGTLSEAALEVIHGEMTRTLELEGIPITRVLHCPHLEQDHCFCRKPRPGLIYRALNETPFLVDVAGSVLIGDADTDMRAGLAAGIGTRIIVGGEAASAATHRVESVSDVLPVVTRHLPRYVASGLSA